MLARDKCAAVANTDDIVLTISLLYIITKEMQLALKRARELASELEVGVNPNKAEVVFLKVRPQRFHVKYLKHRDKASFLGHAFDSKLSWLKGLIRL